MTHLLGFPLGVNGPLQRALYEAIYVAEQGVKVNFLVSRETVRKKILAKSVPEQYKDSVNVYPMRSVLPSGGVGWRLNNLMPLFVEGYGFVRLCRESVLHVHAPSPVSRPLSGCVLRKLLKGPTVLDLHDPWSGHPFSRSPLMVLQTQIMRYAINNADLVVTPHRPLFRLVRAINGNKQVCLIPNGIDTEIFRPRPPNEDLMQELKIYPEDVIVAFSGQITEEKGLDVLVSAAKTVARRFRKTRFLIIGDGPLRKRIERLVQCQGVHKIFRFTGFLSVEELIECLSLADICVCPYKPMPHYKIMKSETPMKVVQYMSMGKPVVMSRISDENVVSWSGGGILVDPGSSQKLAESIDYLIQDESSRREMGEKARNYVQRRLEWSLIAEKLVRLYRTL